MTKNVETNEIMSLHESDQIAQIMIDPMHGSVGSMQAWGIGGFPNDVESLACALDKQCAAIQKGDLSRPEAILTLQAHTLDVVFNKLAEMAGQSKDLQKLDILLKLALKAQSQCRTTIEALAEIKNPRPVAFIRQQNVAQNQQVNNGEASSGKPVDVPSDPRTETTEILPNKLLEEKHVEWVDTGKESQAIGVNTRLEAVEPLHRAKVI